MSKKKKRSTPAAAPAEPAKAEHPQPEEPAVSSTARWMGALCYLSILILIPACTKWRQDEFVRFHLNQGLMVLMLATICAALGFVPVLEQVALSLTLLVDVLSLVGLITALRRRAGLHVDDADVLHRHAVLLEDPGEGEIGRGAGRGGRDRL
ncbi:MAG TPA: hypothetical protein PK278_04725, partial [Gemmiger qucibialis]|nr:hypothetical protein [Gemmiger qucibialis]